ncbi:MAG: hypothetical protein U9Q75_11540 [Pseudomonadota bacterium]|jgi:hypothetical protein|nr:hypothetical protein [Pseudomonadota bacterium]
MLENAFAAASKLPVIEQNTLARWMMDEIESDKKWDKLFAESEDVLGRLAIEAIDEENSGRTTELDSDNL